MHLTLLAFPVGLAELAFEDLARGVAGQGVGEGVAAGDLVAGEAVAGEGVEGGFARW